MSERLLRFDAPLRQSTTIRLAVEYYRYLTIEGYPGETVVLYNALPILGENFSKVNDERLLTRLDDTSARDKLYVASIKGINDSADSGRLQAGGFGMKRQRTLLALFHNNS